MTDGESSEVFTGLIGRRPGARQRRTISATYSECIFPGCRRPASECDLDHRKPWSEGGHTSEDNLAPLCRSDHRLKGESGWSLRRKLDGSHIWRSPLGHRYTTLGPFPDS